MYFDLFDYFDKTLGVIPRFKPRWGSLISGSVKAEVGDGKYTKLAAEVKRHDSSYKVIKVSKNEKLAAYALANYDNGFPNEDNEIRSYLE